MMGELCFYDLKLVKYPQEANGDAMGVTPKITTGGGSINGGNLKMDGLLTRKILIENGLLFGGSPYFRKSPREKW